MKKATQTSKTFSEKLLTWFLCLSLCFQGAIPAFAALPDATLETLLNQEPGIVPAYAGSYQPNEALNTTVIDATDIQDFYHRLSNESPSTITGPMGQLVGNNWVQARLIRTQVQILTGRTFLNSVEAPNPAYSSEGQQIDTLYLNAFNLLKANHSFGQRLGLDPFKSGLAHPVIWPEYRTIQGTPNVLVPVLYLPEGVYETYNVDENKAEIVGTA